MAVWWFWSEKDNDGPERCDSENDYNHSTYHEPGYLGLLDDNGNILTDDTWC